MAKYIVNVIISTCMTIEVEADNEEEAENLAIEEAEPSMDSDWTYDIDCIYRDDDGDD